MDPQKSMKTQWKWLDRSWAVIKKNIIFHLAICLFCWWNFLFKSQNLCFKLQNSISSSAIVDRLTSWWLNQPIWKILVKFRWFPQAEVKIKNIWVATTKLLVDYTTMYQVLQSDLPKVTFSGLENVTSIWGINQKVTLKKLVSYSSSDSLRLHQNKTMFCFSCIEESQPHEMHDPHPWISIQLL